MKTLALVFAAIACCSLNTPAYAQQLSVQLPRDGTGLLDYCSYLVNFLDSPSPETGSLNIDIANNKTKFGWCTGHLQTIGEMIMFWQVRVAQTVENLKGNQSPSADELNQVIPTLPGTTCIPKGVTLEQMARVLVKWLRDHPERLHESISILSVDAFHDAFSCQGTVTR